MCTQKLTGVEVSQDIGWGYERFEYTAQQVRQIKVLLELNQGDIVRVFEILWRNGSMPRDQAHFWLRLIDRVKRAITPGAPRNELISALIEGREVSVPVVHIQ